MKLVDILARELKAWPEPKVPLNGGKDYCCQSDETTEVYFGFRRDSVRLSKRAENTIGVNVTRAEWQSAVDALNAPKVVEWAKGSLPPIGSVVEWDGCTFAAEDPQEKDLHVGDQVTIIAHLKDGDFEIAAFTFKPSIHNPSRGSVWVNQGASGCFRPIRTAEQVAAEERDAKAKDLYLTINWNDVGSTWDSLAASRKADYLKAIDAGYRKEPRPCGS